MNSDELLSLVPAVIRARALAGCEIRYKLLIEGGLCLYCDAHRDLVGTIELGALPALDSDSPDALQNIIGDLVRAHLERLASSKAPAALPDSTLKEPAT